MGVANDVLSYPHVSVSSHFWNCYFHMVDLISSINYTIQEAKSFFMVDVPDEIHKEWMSEASSSILILIKGSILIVTLVV